MKTPEKAHKISIYVAISGIKTCSRNAISKCKCKSKLSGVMDMINTYFTAYHQSMRNKMKFKRHLLLTEIMLILYVIDATKTMINAI